MNKQVLMYWCQTKIVALDRRYKMPSIKHALNISILYSIQICKLWRICVDIFNNFLINRQNFKNVISRQLKKPKFRVTESITINCKNVLRETLTAFVTIGLLLLTRNLSKQHRSPPFLDAELELVYISSNSKQIDAIQTLVNLRQDSFGKTA